MLYVLSDQMNKNIIYFLKTIFIKKSSKKFKKSLKINLLLKFSCSNFNCSHFHKVICRNKSFNIFFLNQIFEYE